MSDSPGSPVRPSSAAGKPTSTPGGVSASSGKVLSTTSSSKPKTPSTGQGKAKSATIAKEAGAAKSGVKSANTNPVAKSTEPKGGVAEKEKDKDNNTNEEEKKRKRKREDEKLKEDMENAMGVSTSQLSPVRRPNQAQNAQKAKQASSSSSSSSSSTATSVSIMDKHQRMYPALPFPSNEPVTSNATCLTSEEVNFLIYRYLLESGFVHSSFVFGFESFVAKTNIEASQVPPGALVSFLQKGLQFMEIEAHLNDDGTETVCDGTFSVVKPHDCTPKTRKRVVDNTGYLMSFGVLELDQEQDATNLHGHTDIVCVCVWNPATGLIASGSADGTVRLWNMDHNMRDRYALPGVRNPEAEIKVRRTAGNSISNAAIVCTPPPPPSSSSSSSNVNDSDAERWQDEAELSTASAAVANTSKKTKPGDDKTKELDSITVKVEEKEKENEPENSKKDDGTDATNEGEKKDKEKEEEKESKESKAGGIEQKEKEKEKEKEKDKESGSDEDDEEDEEGEENGEKEEEDEEEGEEEGGGATPKRIPKKPSSKPANGEDDDDRSSKRQKPAKGTVKEKGEVSSTTATSTADNKNKNDENRTIVAVDWNGKGTRVGGGCYDGSTHIWTAHGKIEHSLLPHHKGPVSALKWNKGGDLLATGSVDRRVMVWDTKSGSLKYTLNAHTGAVMDVDWQSDHTLASCGTDGIVAVWKVNNNSGPSAASSSPSSPLQPKRVHVHHQGEINVVRWNTSGSHLASGSDDTTIKVWGEEGCSVSPVCDLQDHSMEVASIDWAKGSNNILASGSADSTVRVWDIETSKAIKVLSKHVHPVTQVAYSHNADLLASCSHDRLHIWSPKEGLLVRTFRTIDPVGINGFTWRPNVLSIDANGVVSPGESLQDGLACSVFQVAVCLSDHTLLTFDIRV